MAYIVSPYAGAAEFPSDNMPAQLLQQGLQAGYARRMKEMEQKMKLKEEGKKSLDEAYKYAKLDLSKVHPIYQNELLSESNAVTKEAAEAFLKNPTTFAYDTEIADKIGKLNTKKSIYEQRSAFINKDEEAKRQFEKEGKFDVAPTEFGNLMNEYTNPETKPERKKEIEIYWKDNFADANLYTTKLRVAPYTWADYAKEIKDLKLETDKRKISFPQKETVVDIVMNDPNKKASMAVQAGIDLAKPEGENELIKRLESYMPESEKPAPQGSGFGLTFDGNSVQNKKTILTSVTSEKENKEDLTNQFYNQYVNNFIEKMPDFERRKKEASNTGGVYTVENYRNDGSLKKLEQNYPELFQKYKERAKATVEKNERENVTTHFFSTIAPTSNPVDIYLDKKQTLYGRPISFTTDKNGVITNIQYIQDEKAGGITIPKGKTTPITAYNWTLIRDSYGLGDLIKARGIKLPKNIEDALKGESTTSAPKGSERKGAKNESNKIKASQSTLDMLK